MNTWIKFAIVALIGTIVGVMVKTVVGNHTAATTPPAAAS